MRVFLSIPLPSELRPAVNAFAQSLRARLPKGLWTPPGQWHFTLKFLGVISVDQEMKINEALEPLARTAARFDVGLGGVGFFPDPSAARVLWLGVANGGDRVARLAKAIDQTLAPLGFNADPRDHTAHLTLARFSIPAAVDLSVFLELAPPELGTFSVGGFDLVESRPTLYGAEHRVLCHFALGVHRSGEI